MSKAGERAIIQYLGAISSVLAGMLGTMTKDCPSVIKQLDHILEIWEDYEKSSEKV